MIDKTNNNSNNCLFECKELVREHVASSCLNIDCDDYLDAIHEEIDFDKFVEWFDDNLNNFKTKQLQSIYFKKAFIRELNKGKFKLITRVVDITSLVNAMREKGIKVLGDNTAYLQLMWQEYIRLGVGEEQAQTLNQNILNYMKKDQTFDDYIALVRKSKTLRPYKLDWDKLQKRYEEAIEEWDRILNELSLEVSAYDRETT